MQGSLYKEGRPAEIPSHPNPKTHSDTTAQLKTTTTWARHQTRLFSVPVWP